MSIPVALTIAGSDSGGGAGIQADLKTFHAFGVFGTSAITAITAQNTRGVDAVHAVPADVVRAQIAAVATDFDVAAIKTGMLATAELVNIVTTAIREYQLRNFVFDPVMISTSGHRLLDDDAQHALVRDLLPLSILVTPNLAEASAMTGIEVTDEPSMQAAADWLLHNGTAAVLIKGGHLSGNLVRDVFADADDIKTYRRQRIETPHTHGTGCTLSAAITAGLAKGNDLRTAVETALDFVHNAIATAPGLGHGHGPLNHFSALPTTPAD